MTPRGGKREGAGRPKELEDAVDVTVRLSAWQLEAVRAWQERHGLRSVAAAVRMMLVVASEAWDSVGPPAGGIWPTDVMLVAATEGGDDANS